MFIRYRHGTELRIPPAIKPQLRDMVRRLESNEPHETMFRQAIRDIRDGSGPGIAVDATWAAAMHETFRAFERDGALDEQTKQVLLELLNLLTRDQSLTEMWDELRAFIHLHVELLSGWQAVKGYRGSSFFGEIQRDADGTHYVVEHGQKIRVIGAKTAEEERFQYIADDCTHRYGRIARILRLIALIDIADQYARYPHHFSDRIVCLLPDTGYESAYLQWSWHVRGVYNYVPEPWRPRSHFSDPAWLGADVLAHLPGVPKEGTERREPALDPYMQAYFEASRGCVYQYDVALQTDLFLGNLPEVYFEFEGRKVRWINGTRFVYPVLTVWCIRDDGRDGEDIAKRFLSALSKEAKIGIVESTASGGPPRYYPFIRQPRTLGGIGLDPQYLLREDTRNYSARKWLALALYKEGTSSNSVYYSLLCFYKIIQLVFNERGPQIEQWIENNIDATLRRVDDTWRAEVLVAGETAASHLYQSGRNAVAHVGAGGVAANPDDPDHYRRFDRDGRIVRELADLVFDQNLL